MKNMLLFSFSVFSFLALNAQTISYQPLHGNYTQYGYRFQHWNGSENVEILSKTIWSGDTIINGQHYVRIFQGGMYTGGIREDVPNQQRFFINTNDIETNITIDYDLPVGALLTDSSVFLNAFRTYLNVNAPFFQYNDTLMIAAKDSVLESSGNYSVNYRLTDGGGSGESVLFNTYSGLLEINGFEYNYSQICYREDGEQTPPGQQTPWTLMCDLGINESDLIHIELFPNPTSESLSLSGDLGLINGLTIYDLSGTVIKQVPLSEIHSEISLKELRSGIYFLSVNENKKVLRFQKM
ncbi:MAG: T9SS type A sorting domain-containing protein [Fluviicola sp.]